MRAHFRVIAPIHAGIVNLATASSDESVLLSHSWRAVMSGPTRIDLTTAAPTQAPLADVDFTWVCPVCGKLGVFEGGRPLGTGHQDECPECGSALFAPQSRLSPIRASNLAL